MTTRQSRVLSVGHCAFDQGNIRRTVTGAFATTVVDVDSADQAERAVRSDSFDLVLVNRVFDSDGAEGYELIRRLQSSEATRHTPVMLVSNFDDAQARAVALGAKPGFGKDDLGSPALLDLLAPYLAPA